jgi:hypothetical protein
MPTSAEAIFAGEVTRPSDHAFSRISHHGPGRVQARRLTRRPSSLGSSRVAVVAILASGCVGALLLRVPSVAAQTTETPAQLVAAVYPAAAAAGSFHYVNQQTLGINGTLVHQTETGDVTGDVGVQFINGRLGNSEAIVMGSTAYLKGDAAALQVDLLYPLSRANRYANRWISFTSHDTPFQTIKNLVLSSTFWTNPTLAPLDSLPQRPRSISELAKIGGRPMESVTSTIDDVFDSTDSSFIGHAEVYFAATSPLLPYRLTDSTTGTEAGAPFSEQDSASFSKWHEHVQVTYRAGRSAIRPCRRPTRDNAAGELPE